MRSVHFVPQVIRSSGVLGAPRTSNNEATIDINNVLRPIVGTLIHEPASNLSYVPDVLFDAWFGDDNGLRVSRVASRA